MIDQDLFQQYLNEYREDFVPRFKFASGYIWKAVKTFQDNFNLEAENFREMLEKSLSDTGILMTLRSNLNNSEPKNSILKLAEVAPKETKEFFAYLYDEKILITKRLTDAAKKIYDLNQEMYNQGKTTIKKNYQTSYILSLYLCFRYPEKYYLYQESMFRRAVWFLKASYKHEYNKTANNFLNCYLFMNELSKNLKQDEELITKLNSCLKDVHYPDQNLKILTSDFTYFLKMRSRSKERLKYRSKFKKKKQKDRTDNKDTTNNSNAVKNEAKSLPDENKS